MSPRQTLRRAVCALLALVCFGWVAAAQAQSPLIVAPDGDYPTIRAALDAAQPGDTIEVRGGTHDAPLLVDRSVSLIGVDWPVIDGQGEGSLVIIIAPDVHMEGFSLRGTGGSVSREDTAIVVQAQGVTLVGNMLDDVLYGIYFANASDGLARNNTIRCRDYDLSRRGDGMRVWYSDRVHLDSNDIAGCRDTLVWHANNITIENNSFRDSLYGLHFMYSDEATITGNVFSGNSVGAYLMYSRHLTLIDNHMLRNRGTSGYGIAFKDTDYVTVQGNAVVGNRSGLYVDNSPTLPDINNHFTGNFFAYNDIGISALPSVARNVFQSNTFLENTQQASTLGRGNMLGNIWQVDGAGNFWSDYAGYDSTGDGIGDMPYRAEKLFESLADEHPSLRLFTYSPASQSLNFAAAAFPSLRPDPKVIDEAPLMRYVVPAHLTTTTQTVSAPFLAAALLLLGMGGGICLLALRVPGLRRTRTADRYRPAPVRGAERGVR
jgi:nitrous oxidase accessory protein